MAAPETPFAAGQDNIWTKILDHNKLAARQPGTYGLRTPTSTHLSISSLRQCGVGVCDDATGAEQTRPDANLYFVGARGGGKSTLLNRILYPNETATPKPTDVGNPNCNRAG
jgi:hypothetical protein